MSFNRIMMESFVSVGLEEDVVGGDVAAATPEEMDTVVAELADDDQVIDAAGEMDDINRAIETTDMTIDGLDTVAAAVESYRQNGGMDEQAARLFTAAVAAITAPLGGRIAKPLPSLESYSSAGGRLASTTIALEGVRETMAKYVEAVIGFISRMWQGVKDWVKGIFSKEGRYKKAIEAFAKMVSEKLKDSAVAEKDKVKVSNAVGQWVGKDAIMGGNSVKNIAKWYTSLVEAIKKTAGTQVDDLSKIVAELSHASADEKFEFDKVRKELSDKTTAELKSLFSVATPTTSKVFKGWFKDYDVYLVGNFPSGDYSGLGLAIEKTKGYVGNPFSTGKYRVVRPELDSSVNIEEVKAFDVKHMRDFAAGLLETIKVKDTSIKVTEIVIESLDKSTKKVADMILKDVRADKENKPEARVVLKETLRALTNTASSHKNGLTGAYSWLIASWGYALAYGNAQFKNLKEPKTP